MLTQKPSVQLDWLKSLTNRSNLLYILLGNFSLYDFCHLNGQVARRVREEQFSRYHLDQQADAVELTSALKVLLEQVPLQVDIPEMLTHWKWFGEWSIGCIGILSDWVVETAATLCRAGETVLTLEALAKHALKPAQRLKLETEARTGEFKIEEAKKVNRASWPSATWAWEMTAKRLSFSKRPPNETAKLARFLTTKWPWRTSAMCISTNGTI